MIERGLDLFPKLLERFAADRKSHKSVRHVVAPARAPLGGSVHASEARGGANDAATFDEFLGGIFVAQNDAENHSETQHLILSDGMRGMLRQPRKFHLLNLGMVGQARRERFGIVAHAL